MCINPNQSQPLLHWMRVNKEYEELKTVTDHGSTDDAEDVNGTGGGVEQGQRG
jgi:hypothetical protein